MFFKALPKSVASVFKLIFEEIESYNKQTFFLFRFKFILGNL